MPSSRNRVKPCLVFTSLFLGLFAALPTAAAGQIPRKSSGLVAIDASLPSPAVRPLPGRLLGNRNPKGRVLSANSRYLTLDGEPWLPVMGEFHYSRFPVEEWEDAILRMKAGGVQIVSAYVIWIHHEQTEGVFDWKGNKDIRRFAGLCAKHGMYFFPRIGPWVHGEVRNGGLPDWVQMRKPIRENDPVYLKEVDAYYRAIGVQLKGMLWKDGGPVIGVQLENEYVASGPGKGAEHILELKRMALEAGLEVPLYTVTGWGGAAMPVGEVLPVFGGYADAPWDSSSAKLPPSEVYVFRFANRAGGNMGAIGAPGETSASTYEGTPFLTAEVGGGIQDTYMRRPVVSPDDIAAIAPVMLGSGANLLGYYMFHGGSNPDARGVTLQESRRTGYPTDLPVKSYDFQAPVGNDGGERESFRRLKLVNYFLNDFGHFLAPMSVHAPAVLPTDASDLSVPRVAARTDGDAGFLFFENHVRGETTPVQTGFAVTLKLPSRSVQVPVEPIDLPSGAYGIWPVNLDLGDLRLRYSTAQLFKYLERGTERYYFFFAIPGVKAEFAFDNPPPLQSEGFDRLVRSGTTLLRAIGDAGGRIDLDQGKRSTHLVLLSREKAEEVWKLDDPTELALTDAQFFAAEQTLELRSNGDARFRLGLLGAKVDGPRMRNAGNDGVFSMYRGAVPRVDLRVTATRERMVSPRLPGLGGPALFPRPTTPPMAPDDPDFASAATWRLSLSSGRSIPALRDVLLRFDYRGDVARLEQSGQLLEDDFWNGAGWTVGLREVQAGFNRPFNLKVLPWPNVQSIYLEPGAEVKRRSTRSADLNKVEAIPQYGLSIKVDRLP